MFHFNQIEEAINDIRQGRMVIVVDDEDRENEGDLIMAADKVTPEAINFMAKKAGGLICMPVLSSRMDALDIGMMVQKNTDQKQTAFTVSIDAAECETGISAFERAQTIQKVLDPNAVPADFSRPGHVFPLIARPNGVLERAGHTEAAVDLAVLAGCAPAGVICEIMNQDGSMARVPQLMEYAKIHQLRIITIADLIAYRRQTETLVESVSLCEMPTKYGDFRAVGFVSKVTGEEHVALIKGDVDTPDPVLVRIHSECLTGDAFGSLRCDCGEQLQEALRRIEERGRGVLLYLRQEGRGIGLMNKLKAYQLQEMGMDTVEANVALGFKPDLRDYGIAAEILAHLGVHKLQLMTNNPLKIKGLEGYGLELCERIPIEMSCTEKNSFYLHTKMEKMGHLLKFEELAVAHKRQS